MNRKALPNTTTLNNYDPFRHFLNFFLYLPLEGQLYNTDSPVFAITTWLHIASSFCPKQPLSVLQASCQLFLLHQSTWDTSTSVHLTEVSLITSHQGNVCLELLPWGPLFGQSTKGSGCGGWFYSRQACKPELQPEAPSLLSLWFQGLLLQLTLLSTTTLLEGF